MPEKPIRHDLHIPGSKLKVSVRLFSSRQAMLGSIRRAYSRKKENGCGNTTMAHCATSRRILPKGFAAIVYLNRNDLSIGVAAHEFTHAAFAILSRRRIKSIHCNIEEAADNEETFCDVVEKLTDQFYKRFGIH